VVTRLAPAGKIRFFLIWDWAGIEAYWLDRCGKSYGGTQLNESNVIPLKIKVDFD